MLYKFLNLPKIPKNLLDSLQPSDSALVRTMKGPVYLREGKSYTTFVGKHYAVTDELAQWIRENISNQFNDIGLRITDGNINRQNSIAHTDLTRTYTLMYNLDHAEGHINIWQETGFPILRNQPGYVVKNYDRLRLLESIETPNHTWYLLNSSVLHSVENTVRPRINIQIGFDEDPQL